MQSSASALKRARFFLLPGNWVNAPLSWISKNINYKENVIPFLPKNQRTQVRKEKKLNN